MGRMVLHKIKLMQWAVSFKNYLHIKYDREMNFFVGNYHIIPIGCTILLQSTLSITSQSLIPGAATPLSYLVRKPMFRRS